MNDFAAHQVTRSHVLHINGQSDDVFGLFDPIGEKKWSAEWDPKMIFPPSQVCQGAVFVTRDEEETETIWIITMLDQNSHCIAYTSVTPNFKVSLIEISCERDGVNRTKARVTYIITALSEKGNQYVDSFSEEHYHQWMMDWEKAINHYLESGCPFRHH